MPQGQAAVGWRVSVYWRGDQTFYDGRIVSYNSSNGQHTILYDDEEVGQLVLTAEKLIWRQPPTDNPKRDAAAAAATRDAIAAAGGFATAAGPGDVMLYDDDDPFMSDSDEPEEEDDSDDSDDGRGGNKRKGGAAAAGKKRKKGPAAAAAGGPQKKQKGGAKRPGQEVGWWGFAEGLVCDVASHVQLPNGGLAWSTESRCDASAKLHVLRCKVDIHISTVRSCGQS